MGVRNANHLAARLIGAFVLGWALLLSPAAPFAADGPNLPSARYVPPPVGTLVKYDDRSYKVVRTEGYLTVFQTRKGGLQSWLYAYALFGETADDLYVSSRAPVSYDIDDKNKRMLEAFWPLRVGKSVSFEVEEFGGGYAGAPQTWEITLRVTGTAIINLNATEYATFVIEERARSSGGMSFTGRKWFHPASGLIVKVHRRWVDTPHLPPMDESIKVPNFAAGEEENYALIEAIFP